jgi:hypothetical protein
MESKNDLIEAREEFFKLLPIIPIWLTLIGAIKIFIDYNRYNINIFQYLDFQEILTLFTHDLLTYIIASNAGLLFYSFVNDDSIWVVNIEKLNAPNWLKGLLGVLVAVIPVLLIGYASLMIIGEDFSIYYKKSAWIKWVHFIIYCIGFQLLISTCYKIFRYIKGIVSYPVFLVYRYYIFFLLFVSFFTYIQILNSMVIVKYNEELGGYITTENQTIYFNADNQLIGRTKNYFFIYTTGDNCTAVIPASTVKDIFVKGRKIF